MLTEKHTAAVQLWLLLPPGGQMRLLQTPGSPHERPACALCWQVIYIEADVSLRWCSGSSCQTMKHFFCSSLGEVREDFLIFLSCFS